VNQKVALAQQKVALFSWHGATVEVEGRVDIACAPCRLAHTRTLSLTGTARSYVAGDTPMAMYVNVHAVLEERRKAAKSAGPSVRGGGWQLRGGASPDETSARAQSDGPRVLIAGPADVGKSTLSRLLANYAVRSGWAPVLVDLDLGQGGITCPGTLAALPMDEPLPPGGGVPLEVALVYYFGAPSPADNPELFCHLTERLGAALEARHGAAPASRAAGAIINTCGWVEGVGKSLLVAAARALRADVVLVLGAERLHAELAAALPGVACVALRKSGGVVARPPEARRAARSTRTREYFYGPSAGPALCPHAVSCRFDELQLFRVGGGPRAPSSALPLGAQPAASPLRCAPVVPSLELLHSVLAVSHAESVAELLSANMAGFIHVTDVDMAARRITYLAPCSGPLPGKLLLVGSIKWFESA
jgi:polyribonucleotide 5'-hydroxyl-kinase